MSQLDEIEARIADCKTYNFGMRNADTLAHFDAPFLLAIVREQAAKLEAIRVLCDEEDARQTAKPYAAVSALRAALEARA